MAKVLSLCLTTQKINNHEQTFLFRLADKKKDQFVVPDNYSEDGENFKTYDFHPKTAYKNHKINELKIWEWDTESTEFAEKTHTSFYELVCIPGVEGLEKEKIVSLLKEGFSLDGYDGSKLLLLISENIEEYKVLELDASSIKICENILKLNKNVSSLKGYNLKKIDFFNTEHVTVFSKNGERFKPRYIYKFMTIDEPSFDFEVLTFDEKLVLFFKQVANQNGLNSENRKIIINVINQICENEKAIKDFFEDNNFSVRELEKNLIEKREHFELVLNNKGLLSEFCESVVENFPIVRDNFVKRLINEKEILNTDLISEVNQNELELEDLMFERNKHLKEISELKLKKREIDLKILESERIYDILKSSIKEKALETKTTISSFIQELMFLDILNGYEPKKSAEIKERKHYELRKTESINTVDFEFLEDIYDFVEVLAKNLVVAGVDKDYKDLVAYYVTATAQQQSTLLITGKYSRNIADAISVTFSGYPAQVLSVISPEITATEIIEEFGHLQDKVINIENILSQNDHVALQMLNLNHENWLILTNSFSEVLNFVPNSFWDRCNLLCTDNLCADENSCSFEFTQIEKSKVIDSADPFDKKAFREIKRTFQDSIKHENFTKSLCSAKCELITRIEQFDDGWGIFTWLICETIPLMQFKNQTEQVSELLELFDLNENQIESIKQIFWWII